MKEYKFKVKSITEQKLYDRTKIHGRASEALSAVQREITELSEVSQQIDDRLRELEEKKTTLRIIVEGDPE